MAEASQAINDTSLEAESVLIAIYRDMSKTNGGDCGAFIEDAYGIMGFKGTAEELERFALDPEFDGLDGRQNQTSPPPAPGGVGQPDAVSVCEAARIGFVKVSV